MPHRPMCEQCTQLLRHPHVASDIDRLKELGVSEQTRAVGGPIVRKRYQCTLCGTHWTMTKDKSGPSEVWAAER